MLSLPPSVRIWICTRVCDMRRSFDGLARMVQEFLDADPLSGHLFVFGNRRRDRVKILFWDRDGLAIFYKRLEEGTFQLPLSEDGEGGVEIRSSDLAMLLDGVDITSVKRHKRYRRPAPATAGCQ